MTERRGCFVVKRLFLRKRLIHEGVHAAMERLIDIRKTLCELNESYIDLVRATKATAQNNHDAKQLWRAGCKSRLVKIGVARSS